MTYFTAALRHGNIARAAEELNISASAVSAAIDQIEEAFDLTLTTRQRSRGIAATASGRLIAAKFERLLEDYDAVLAEGAELKQALRGDLRVGYYAPIAPAFLPEVFASFLPDDSDVVLHLEECDNDAAQDGFMRGAYDVILFVTEGARASIAFDVLIEAPPYCLLPASHALADRPGLRLEEIAREPLVVLNRPAAAAYYHRLFETRTAPIAVAAYANSTEMVRSLVGRGHGLAVLNMQPLTAISYGGDDLVALPITDPLPPLTLAIASDRARPRRLVQHFVEACLAHFAAEGPHRCVVAP
jgi:DNA-binding transcriptional LysR family regulator